MCQCELNFDVPHPERLSLSNVFKARIRLSPYLRPSPLQRNARFSSQLGTEVYLKREDLQQVRSFKIRGALNRMLQMSAQQKFAGVVCASAGNHAQGVAFACHQLRVHGVIYMPENTPVQKVEQVRFLGGQYVEVIQTGCSFESACLAASSHSEKTGRFFIHPFDDPEVICGQATLALELVSQLRSPLDVLYVPVGGGGLASGVALVTKALWSSTKIVGVEASGSNAMAVSLAQRKRVTLSHVDPFADGTAVATVGQYGYQVCQKLLDSVVTVSDSEVVEALYCLNNDHGMVVEPSGALGVAALLHHSGSNERVGVIISGGNNDARRFSEYEQRLAG